MALASLQAAEAGKLLSFTQSSTGPNMTGATVYLLINSQQYGESTYTCSIASDGITPQYLTTGSEFQDYGSNYIASIQLRYVDGNNVYYSPVASLNILTNIPH